MCKSLLLVALLMPFSYASGGTTSKALTVSAEIEYGCAIGNQLTPTPTVNLGTIDFGSMPRVANQIDVTSTVGTGSIVVTCTPGTNVSIALDSGKNGANNLRYLSNIASTTKFAYQLYKDAARSAVWGNGAQAVTIANFPSTTQVYTVYARLFANNIYPMTGVYTDTVTVTLTY